MKRAVQTLTDNAPLHRRVFVVIKRSDFFNAPAQRAMIDDDILAAEARDRVLLQPVYVAEANAQITNDDIIRSNNERIIASANALAGRGLSGNGAIAVRDAQFGLQRNRAGHAKDNRPRALRGNGCAQTALAAVIQIGDGNYFSAAPPHSSIGQILPRRGKRAVACGRMRCSRAVISRPACLQRASLKTSFRRNLFKHWDCSLMRGCAKHSKRSFQNDTLKGVAAFMRTQ